MAKKKKRIPRGLLFDLSDAPGASNLEMGMTVRVYRRKGIGVFIGEIEGIYPLGLKVWRDGVKRTKPHFCKFNEVGSMGCVDPPKSMKGRNHGKND